MTFLESLPLIAVMAGVTYLIRMLPITLVRGRLRSRFLQRFLTYIPYAVLSAMTVPAIFTAAGDTIPSLVGCAIGATLALREKSLTVVAIAACLGALAANLLLHAVA